jgi:hypothetical protein
VATIRLNSTGGNILEALKIAELIRTGKIASAVLSKTTCASACFIILSAGSEKYVHYTAAVGVHGASEAEGGETTEAKAATVTMARVLKELGVPPAILGKMVTTPPDQMVWLTPDDLKAMGVAMLGKPSQLEASAPVPTAPLQLGPTPPASMQASTPPSWESIVENALEAARQQNGRVAPSRVCQPELKTCSNAVFFRMKDGTEAMVRKTENIEGTTIAREVCTFNKFKDIRTCLNWDSSKLTKEMKSATGDWHLVESQ